MVDSDDAATSIDEAAEEMRRIWLRRVVVAFLVGFLLAVLFFGSYLKFAPSGEATPDSLSYAPSGISQEATDSVTIESTAGVQPAYQLIHSSPADCITCHVPSHALILSCRDCHSDYRDGWVTDHPVKSNCSSCHNKPKVHYPGTCSTCHQNTDSFKVVEYPHDAGDTCTDCHNKPKVHYPGTCSTCHQNTDSFKVVEYPHDAGDTCTDCHQAGHDDKGSDCVGCHSKPGADWRFTHEARNDCSSCHTRPVNHYGTTCGSCHKPPVAAAASWTLGCGTSGCHSENPIDSHIPEEANESCLACHDAGNLARIHLGAQTTGTDGKTYESCLVCHSPSVQPIARLCGTCHTDMDPEHGDLTALHRSSPSDENISIDGLDYGPFGCVVCHDLVVTDEHAKTTSENYAAGCAVCHDTPRDTFDTWDESCVQGGCHVVSSPQEQHDEIDADHALSAEESSSCETSGCHTGDRAALHQNATTVVDAVTRESCMICHSEGVPAAATCEDCHTPLHSALDHSPGRASCQLSGCHDQTVEDTHLACISCHFLPTPPPDDTNCLNCHTVQPEHVAADAQHTGDATGTGSRWIPSCGGVGRYDFVGLCHDVTNVMETHVNMHDGSDGCPTCHDGSIAPIARCVTCHPKYGPPANGVGIGNTAYMHHNNNKYVADQLEVAEGSYYTTAPVGGWDDTVTNYDCQFCHYNFFIWGAKPVPPTPRSPYAGDSMWYAGLRSVAGSAKDTTLSVGAFSATDSLELEYMVNYQTYAGYDYGYSEVSTDSVTWITVPGNITSTDPVTTRHLGNGIAGDSAGWVRATFDLSAYAGQDIEVRLRYKTNYYGVSLFGYAVDDIVVRDAGGTLFSNDAESVDMPTRYWRRTGSYPPPYYPDNPNN